ncbi:MAG: biotin/lipoyl-binding protein, partial [Actinobacteria bacterium]
AFSHESSELSVVYETDKSGLRLVEPPDVTVGEVSAGSVELIAGESMRLEVSRYGSERFVDGAAGSARLTLLPRFPSASRTDTEGSLHAPMPGRIVRVEVSEGDAVSDGQPLIVLEAMKMEHTLRAPHQGTVTSVNCRVGDQVEGNDVLIVVE